MDSSGFSKPRALAINTIQPAGTVVKNRPKLGERHQSAPLVPRSYQQTAQGAARSAGVDVIASTNAPNGLRRGSVPRLAKFQAHQTPDTARTDGDTWGENTRSQISRADGYRLLKLVVVGNTGVGKSRFVRDALELRKSTSSLISSSWVSLRGAVHRVQMIELELATINIEDDLYVIWPKYVDNSPFTSPDSVICLYDSTSKASLDGLPQFLSALANLEMPVQLVDSASQSSGVASRNKFAFADSVRQRLPEVFIVESEDTAALTAKKAMLIALREAILAADDDEDSPERPPTPLGPSQPVSLDCIQDKAIARKQTEFPNPRTSEDIESSSVSSGDVDEGSADDSDDPLAEDNSVVARSNAVPASQNTITRHNIAAMSHQEPRTPVSEDGQELSEENVELSKQPIHVPYTPESYAISTRKRSGTSGTVDSRAHQTFFDGDDDDSSSEQDDEMKASKCSFSSAAASESDQGVTFVSLVDRLLRLPETKQEAKFVPTFLCLYRSFATPSELLSEVINRVTLVEEGNEVPFNKVAELLRYLQVMADWTATYPGDFADQTVRDTAISFVHELEKSRNLIPAAKEICNNLQSVAEDEDLDWSYRGHDIRDISTDTTEPIRPRGRIGSVPTLASIDESEIESDTEDELKRFRSSVRNSGTASTASSVLKTASISSQSAANLIALGEAREQASKLRSVPHIDLTKVQWRFFMETPTEDLARELTRIDWIRYSAIRPRDFIRDAVLSGNKGTGKNISMLIKHFNHISYFVASMILLRDKPKHRAKAVEKIMDLAWKVRQLNNYNCVNAIVAGMQNTAVTRLHQTLEHVPTETQRQFMRLTILVDATKSYATYRIAWENTSSERIPLVPSLQKDLKIAMLANPTFTGNRIMWKKFEIMGDAIISIQKSQETSYSFPSKTQRVQEIMSLFLETKVVETTDEHADPSKELYDRSKQVEPNAPNVDLKKRFDWLRR